eukprot:257994-Chlamydomonas_euryale.AAC.1
MEKLAPCCGCGSGGLPPDAVLCSSTDERRLRGGGGVGAGLPWDGCLDNAGDAPPGAAGELSGARSSGSAPDVPAREMPLGSGGSPAGVPATGAAWLGPGAGAPRTAWGGAPRGSSSCITLGVATLRVAMPALRASNELVRGIDTLVRRGLTWWVAIHKPPSPCSSC